MVEHRGGKAIPDEAVVPAKAGTHTRRCSQLRTTIAKSLPQSKVLGLWVPAFAGTTR